MVIGIDEVGRGALAGPVVVAAVAIEAGSAPPIGLRDSKALSAAQRRRLVPLIHDWSSAIGVGSASAAEIDAWGLTWALAVACHRAIAPLNPAGATLLIDGTQNLLRPSTPRPRAVSPESVATRYRDFELVVKGDQKCSTIAAASVVAKVHRDDVMVALADEHPGLAWDQNKGYGTPGHLEAIRSGRVCGHHRRTWSPFSVKMDLTL
jgi:ribonuclease HII